MCVCYMRVNKGMIEVCKCAAVFSFFPSLCSTGSQLWYLCNMYLSLSYPGRTFLNPASVKAQLLGVYFSVPLVIICAYVVTQQL